MIKLKINGVVVREFTLHNDSVGFTPHTIDTFVTCSQPMYYQPQPVYYYPQTQTVCPNVMPNCSTETDTETTAPSAQKTNKPIRPFVTSKYTVNIVKTSEPVDEVFDGILHGNHSKPEHQDTELDAIYADLHGKFDDVFDNDEFDDLAGIGITFDPILKTIASGVNETYDYKRGSKSHNELNTIAVLFKPDTDYNVDSERTRNWIMSGRAYIWYTAQQAFIDELCGSRLTHSTLGTAFNDVYYATVGVICAFCKKYNTVMPTPFNSTVFDMPIVKLSKDLTGPYDDEMHSCMNTSKAGGMYVEY